MNRGTSSCRLMAIAIVFWIGGLAASSATVAGETSADQGQIILRQTVLGPMPTDPRDWSIAPDASRLALVANSGTRQQVYIDGNAGALYSTIVQLSKLGQGDSGPRLLMISPDATQVAYVATKGPTDYVMVVNHKESPVFERISAATFAPVGHRLAFVASKGGKQYLVVDGKMSPGYASVAASELAFTADGKHLGYVVQTNEQPAKWRAVVDGKEGASYESVSSLRLGRNGRFAYVARKSTNIWDNYMVIDGQEGPTFAVFQPAIFSQDGTHVGYIATRAQRAAGTFGSPPSVAVIDGKVGPDYPEVAQLTFSPDGKRSVYTGTETGTQRVNKYAMVDGQKSLDYVGATSYLFSPDSQHLAYVATSSGANGVKYVVVLDGHEQDAHAQVDFESLRFSPDGQHLGYLVREQDRAYAVIDGKKSAAHGAIEARTFQWSPELGQFRYKTRGSTDAWYAGIGTQPAGGDPIAELVATPDGKHSAAVVLKAAGSSQQSAQVMLDGKPIGETYGSVDQLQISADGVHVAFLAGATQQSGKKGMFAVFDGHEGPGNFRIDRLLLSPDGQHIAYNVTAEGPKYHVVVDSLKGPAYEQVPLGLTQRYEGLQFRPDGSLVFLAVTEGKLNRMVYPADSLRSIPKSAGGAGAAAGGAPGYSQIYAFGKVEKDGTKPAVLTAAPDGTLYGATSAGGKYQKGVLFKLKPDGSDYTIIHPFAGGRSDGAYPSSIWAGPDGALYGSLQNEANGGYGAIFRCAADGSDYKLLHAFTASDNDGASPVILAMDPDGTLYGISSRVNRTPLGLFRMKPDGSEFSLVYKAPPHIGGKDTAGVGLFTDGGDGSFYGVNSQAIFKIKKDGTGYTIVREFEGPPLDVNSADRAPILGSDGMLYGIASSGGQSQGGVIYKLARDGSKYTLIVNPESEQLQPRALAEGPDGKLYALARQGLVRCNKDGSDFTVLQEMNGGFFPWGAVVNGGAFYSTTAQGGKGGGIIFRYGIGGSPSGGAVEPAAVIQNVPTTPLDANVELPAQ